MLRRLTEQERAALKAEFLRRAGEEFERTFDPEAQPSLRTFTQKEDRAFEAGDGLGRFLLEAQVREEETARPVDAYPCPDCGRPTLTKEEEEEPPEREVVTRRGAVRIARPERACPACRRALFPPRP